MPHIRCTVHVLAQRKRSLSTLLHQPCKHRELLCIKRIPLRQCAGVLLKIMDRTQHCTVWAAAAQGRQRRPERRLFHLTQQQLADKTGMAKGTISAYEQGKKYPSVEVLIKLCNTFQVSADYLLGLSDDLQLMKSNLTDEQMSVFRKLIHELEQSNAIRNLPN